MHTVTSSGVRDNPARRIVTIDHLRLMKRFVTAKPMPRRRLRGAYPLPLIEADAPDALGLREWLVWWLRAAKVSKRDTTIALRLADGETVRAVAPRARLSPQRVQQIGDQLARGFDRCYRTA